MKTGMIIVNYNDFDSTIRLIENVKDYKIIEKIVIVDNNSRKEEQEKLKTIKYKKVKIIFLEENKGYSAAINKGAKYLIGEFGKCNIIVSNADVIIKEEKHIKELLKTLFPKDVAIASPVIFEQQHLNRGWKNPTPKQEILMSLPKIYKKMEKKYRYYKEEHYKEKEATVDVVSGCFFLIKSTILEDIKYLDENVFLYYEENILSKKIQKLGLKTKVNNEIVIIHDHSVTINKSLNRVEKLKTLNKSKLYFEENYNNATKRELNTLKSILKLSESILVLTNLFTKYKRKG